MQLVQANVDKVRKEIDSLGIATIEQEVQHL